MAGAAGGEGGEGKGRRRRTFYDGPMVTVTAGRLVRRLARSGGGARGITVASGGSENGAGRRGRGR